MEKTESNQRKKQNRMVWFQAVPEEKRSVRGTLLAPDDYQWEIQWKTRAKDCAIHLVLVRKCVCAKICASFGLLQLTLIDISEKYQKNIELCLALFTNPTLDFIVFLWALFN